MDSQVVVDQWKRLSNQVISAGSIGSLKKKRKKYEKKHVAFNPLSTKTFIPNIITKLH